jgi:hypothetical protein
MNTEPASTNSRTPASPNAESSIDEPYTFGRPTTTYLSPREVVRLTIVRSRLLEREDVRARRVA